MGQYPKYMHHASKPPVMVESAQQQAEFGSEWSEKYIYQAYPGCGKSGRFRNEEFFDSHISKVRHALSGKQQIALRCEQSALVQDVRVHSAGRRNLRHPVAQQSPDPNVLDYGYSGVTQNRP
jgi:hypothetical protein